MAQEWHYAWQGQSHGPVDEEALEDLIRAGRVRADTLIWSEGMTNWEPAGNHFSFGQNNGAASPPPMPGRNAATGSGLYSGAPARSFGEAIKVCFKKYATFKGRASRSEYWWFMLFVWLISIVGAVLEGTMGNDGAAISGLISLATFLPSLSAQIRRLHDTGRSGWWVGGFYIAMILGGGLIGATVAMSGSSGEPGGAGMGLIAVLSIAGLAYAIAMLVFMVKRGDPGPNRFG